MKNFLFIFLLIFIGFNASAQNLYLKISGKTDLETKSIDSLSYNSIHINAKSVLEEANLISDKLIKVGFIETTILEQTKSNDSTFLFKLSLGKKINFIHIYIGRNSKIKNMSLFETKTDTLTMPFANVEDFMKTTLSKLEKKGFALSKLKLINIQKKKIFMNAELQIILDKKRGLNDVVINGYDKFPEGYKASIKKKYKNKIFNQDNLKKINEDLNKIHFIRQTKYPEILFTTDSTKIYVYIEKAKTNTFDGFIGFSNDENRKITFNGYLDLALNNALNIGEKISIYWKSDGREQKTFNAGAELPYVFKSPLGIKGELNIFKQDSTFQNTKTALDLGYFFNYNSKLYFGYQATESNDIKNANTSSLSDFKNSYITANYEFIDFENDNFLFPEKTNFNLKFGTGKRNSKTQYNKQFFASLILNHHFYLNKKNAINIKSENFYLKSNSYIVNELFRFGGINSIRGFNENSLQANTLTSILTEYQYILAPSIYVHTILDYGYFQDKTSNASGKLLGLGFGFGLQTKNGLFNLVYANGSTNNQAVKLSNSIVHISLKTNF